MAKDSVQSTMGFSCWGYELSWLLTVWAEPGGTWIILACSPQQRTEMLLTEPASGKCEFGFKGDLLGVLYELSEEKCDQSRCIKAILPSK